MNIGGDVMSGVRAYDFLLNTKFGFIWLTVLYNFRKKISYCVVIIYSCNNLLIDVCAIGTTMPASMWKIIGKWYSS